MKFAIELCCLLCGLKNAVDVVATEVDCCLIGFWSIDVEGSGSSIISEFDSFTYNLEVLLFTYLILIIHNLKF